MHLEILVEGKSDKVAVSILLEKIVGEYRCPHTWRIHSHKGVGKILNTLNHKIDPKNETLLHQLPSKLKSYNAQEKNNFFVVVLLDLDNNENCKKIKQNLLEISNFYAPTLNILFRIAVKELETWFLGDQQALKRAYPNADQKEMDSYNPCPENGNWELLANAIYPGGSAQLKDRRFVRTGRRGEQKIKWASKICPYMDVENNESPSFCVFRDGIRNMIEKHGKPSLPRPRA